VVRTHERRQRTIALLILAHALLWMGCAESGPASGRRATATTGAFDGCRVQAEATWGDGLLTIDLTPTAGQSFISANAVVTRGHLVASFGEAGVPSFLIAPDPGVERLLVVVPTTCGRRTSDLRLLVDSRSRRKGDHAPVTTQPNGATD